MIQAVAAPPIPNLPSVMRRLVKLPPGTPLLFKPDGTFAKEVHLFLFDRVIRKIGKKPSLKTLHAYAEDLSNWWAFLESNDLEWTPMNDESIRDYADILQQTISPKTGEKYKPATITRRVGTVIEFYRWAVDQGLAECNLSNRTVKTFKNRSSDDLHLAHISTKQSSISIRISHGDPSDRVNILSPIQTRRILNWLGPDLKELRKLGKKPMRDRLISEWSLLTGVRLKEVVGLKVAEIIAVSKGVRFDRPAKLIKLLVTDTKGGKPRKVLVPAYLLRATVHYIKNERMNAIKAALLRNKQFQEPEEVFVNGLDANAAYIGRKLSGKIASAHFTKAVLACGYSNKVSTIKGNKVKADFHFHDLRHTFAVRMYTLLESLGKREPWKTLQTLLGHKYLSTTIKTYLKHVHVDEAVLGDAVSLHLEMLAKRLD